MNSDQIKSCMVFAYQLAAKSRDPSNQNGAVVVVGSDRVGSWNDFPQGVEFTDERNARPLKYDFFDHAETGAIYGAAKLGVPTDGATMVCPWAACCGCARGIIRSGIKRLIVHQPRMQMTPNRWLSDVDRALTMLLEAGVVIERFLAPINSVRQILVNGELWSPASEPVEGGNWEVGRDGRSMAT